MDREIDNIDTQNNISNKVRNITFFKINKIDTFLKYSFLNCKVSFTSYPKSNKNTKKTFIYKGLSLIVKYIYIYQKIMEIGMRIYERTGHISDQKKDKKKEEKEIVI